MLKNFNNFAYESSSARFYQSQDMSNNSRIDIRDLYDTFSNNEELVCNALNRRLIERHIKISEMRYDERTRVFKWVPLTKKFLEFNMAGRIDGKYYINFDDTCFIELSRKLLIESILTISDI